MFIRVMPGWICVLAVGLAGCSAETTGGSGGLPDVLNSDATLNFSDSGKKPDGAAPKDALDAGVDGGDAKDAKSGDATDAQPADVAEPTDIGPDAALTDAADTAAGPGDTGGAGDVATPDVPACKPVPETCNGADDDCDGATDESCDDGEPCTVNDLCAQGDCVGSLMDCNDNDKCTADGCTGGVCGHTQFTCNDNNPCTSDGCDVSSGCTHAATADACDDGNPCTDQDDCSQGVCLGKPKNCDDGQACTTDQCDVVAGCLHKNATGACDDGNPCTSGETCSGGACAGGAAKLCDDGNACTSDSCDASGCVFTALDAPCQDGNACTTGDNCVAKTCVAGSAVPCVDNNPCTDDACTPQSGCLFTANNAACDDGSTCTVNDVCGNSVCSGSSPCPAGSWCDGQGGCPACNTAAHCGATCAVCGGATPDCDGAACVCNASSCAANQVCNGSCAVCATDAACGASCSACGGATPKCLGQGATSACVSCLSAADCPSGWACSGNTCTDACQINFSFDFESGDQGFTHAPTSGIKGDDPWVNGTPTGVTCHSGKKCWATNLATAGYSDCQMAQLLSPTADLSSCAGSAKTLTLQFWHYYKFEIFSSSKWWDGGVLQVSKDSGATWADVVTSQAYQGLIQGSYDTCTPTPDISGHSGWSGEIPGKAWTLVSWTVPNDYRVNGVAFRWLFGADGNTTDRGWFVDDISLVAQ